MKFKKVLLPFITGALALSLAACSEEDKAVKEETPQAETEQGATKEEEESANKMQAKLDEQQVDKSKIVAIVNEEEVIGEEYNSVLTIIQSQMQQAGQDPSSEEAAEQVKKQVLDTLVNQKLILQKAKEAEIKASTSEIDEEFLTYEEQFGGEKEMKKALKDQGMDEKILKEKIAEFIITEKYLAKVAPAGEVTDKEIKEYYDQVAAKSKEAGQELPPLEESSKEIQTILEQQQQQKLFVTHIEELKEDAKVEFKI